MAATIASVAAAGSCDGGVGAAFQGGDEEAELFRFFFQRLAVGDQDELVVGRDAELVDRGDHRVFAALLQVDALDVADSRRASPGPSRRAAPAAGRSRR